MQKSVNKIAVSVSEGAEMLSVSRPTMYEIIKRSDFNASFHVGNRTLISVVGLQNWVEQQTAGGIDNAQ